MAKQLPERDKSPGAGSAARKPSVGASAQVLGMQIPQSLAGPEIGGDFQVIDLLALNLSWNPDIWGVSRNKWQASVGSARAAEVDG